MFHPKHVELFAGNKNTGQKSVILENLKKKFYNSERWLLRSSEMWPCVAGCRRFERTACHHLEMPNGLGFGIDPWRWRDYCLSKRQEPLSQWHSVIAQKTPNSHSAQLTPSANFYLYTATIPALQHPLSTVSWLPASFGVERNKRWSDLSPSCRAVHRLL
jgi:hypothetical protein